MFKNICKYTNCYNGGAKFPSFLSTTSSQYSTSHADLPNENKDIKGPLAGIRILDMTRVLAGPFATMVLADLGASVIKVEKIDGGDETRLWGPPFIGPPESSQSCYFLSVNRNKASLAIDLKKQDGVNILKELVKKCDVLIENFVPGSLSRLGLGYDDLQPIAPRLIYCSLTGYGPTGPYSNRPGYDVMAASFGGLIGVTGPPSGEPCKVGVAMTDLATGLYAHGAVMAALIERNKTGEGQKIDCDLLSTQVACMSNLASSYLNGGLDAKASGTAHASIVPYQAFKTRDGYISIAGNNNAQFGALCERLDLFQLTTDQRYCDNSKRVENRETLILSLSEKFAEKTTHQWLAKFEGSSFPYAPINSLAETFQDPQVVHKGLVQSIQHSNGISVRVVGPPVQYSSSVNCVRAAPPALGQHTRPILDKIVGLSYKRISELHQQGVVRCADMDGDTTTCSTLR